MSDPATPPPSQNGPIGAIGLRGPSGRFTKGNAGGPGNPHAKRVHRLRSSLLAAVSTADMKAIVAKLVEEAKGGNVQAAKELLERLLGKATSDDFVERIERLEQAMAVFEAGGQ